jgi:hypothetical protein
MKAFLDVKATRKRTMMRYEIIMSDRFQVADLYITRAPMIELYIYIHVFTIAGVIVTQVECFKGK